MKTLFFLIPTVFFFICPSFSQEKRTKIGMNNFKPIPSIYDKKVFNSIFKYKTSKKTKIIALGEFSHGSYEPIAFKANLVKYLIEVKGYRNILFEQPDFSVLKEIRTYLIDNNRNDSESIKGFIEDNHFTRATSFVFLDLLKWIKYYNLNNPSDLVTINGFEIDVNEKILEYILSKYIVPLDYKKSQHYISNLYSQTNYIDKLNSIQKWYNNEEQMLKQNFDKKDIDQLIFLIKNAIMSAEYAKKNTEKSFNNLEEKSQFRDSVMANNIIELSTDKKSIVWAHNGHVLRTKSNHMGSRLNKFFGDGFYVVVTDFSKTAAIDFVNQDSSGLDKAKYSTKIIFSENSTAANKLLKKYNIEEGIFCLGEVLKKEIGQNTNAIGTHGSHFMIPGNSKSFDLLVIFKNSYPMPEK